MNGIKLYGAINLTLEFERAIPRHSMAEAFLNCVLTSRPVTKYELRNFASLKCLH